MLEQRKRNIWDVLSDVLKLFLLDVTIGVFLTVVLGVFPNWIGLMFCLSLVVLMIKVNLIIFDALLDDAPFYGTMKMGV